MARPDSVGLRLRAVALVAAGQSRHSVTRRLDLGKATVIRWMKRQTTRPAALPPSRSGRAAG